jgi:hypothetical protein
VDRDRLGPEGVTPRRSSGPIVDPPNPPSAGPSPANAWSAEERRWLHDKYERLAAEEATLSAGRTSYYAAIGTVLITGLLVAIDDFSNQPAVLAAVIALLGVLGIMISSVWAILLHRTNDAQNLWREAAFRLEQLNPPLLGELRAPITLRSRQTLPLNLLRPYEAHAERFSTKNPISWMDRVDPSGLVEILPKVFLLLWGGVLVADAIWFLVLH